MKVVLQPEAAIFGVVDGEARLKDHTCTMYRQAGSRGEKLQYVNI